MKNIVLAVFAVIALSGSAHAQSLQNVQAVKVITPYKLTCSSFTLLSATPTEMTNNTADVRTSSAIYVLRITPLDSSATSYFSDNASVSVSGANIGWPVYPIGSSGAMSQPNPQIFEISSMQKWYGISTINGSSVQLCKKK